MAQERPANGFELQVRCVPLHTLDGALYAAGYRVVARGVDRDGDGVRLYRTGDSKWLFVSLLKGPDDAALGCPVLSGERMAVGDFGPGA